MHLTKVKLANTKLTEKQKILVDTFLNLQFQYPKKGLRLQSYLIKQN